MFIQSLINLSLIYPDSEHFTNGMIVKCDIYKQDHTEANLVNYMYAGQEHQGFTLVGNTTASGHLIEDFEDAQRMAVYFVFADLSVRTEGSYSFKFRLFCISK